MRRRRDGQVQPQLVREGRPGEGDLRDPRAEDGDEVVAAGLRDAELVQLVQHGGQDRGLVVLLELRVVRRARAVPVVLEPGRDDDFVDQRVAEAGHLRPAAMEDAVDRHVLTVGRRPDADHVRAVCRPARSGSAGRSCGRCSRTGSPCHRPCSPSSRPCGSRRGRRWRRRPRRTDRHAGRRRSTTPPRVDDRLLGRRLVVLDADEAVEARADVVDRRLAGRPGLAVPGRRPRLLRVAEEVRAGRGLEPERVRHVRPAVAVPVDVDVVAGRLRERVVVRAGSRVLTGDPVGHDGERARLVRAAERVQVRVVRGRILRDQRRLPVAGRRARARGETPDEERGETGGGRDQEEQRVLLHLRVCSFLVDGRVACRGPWPSSRLIRRAGGPVRTPLSPVAEGLRLGVLPDRAANGTERR